MSALDGLLDAIAAYDAVEAAVVVAVAVAAALMVVRNFVAAVDGAAASHRQP